MKGFIGWFLLFSFAVSARAQEKAKDWPDYQWRQAIEAPGEADQLFRIKLDGPYYDGLRGQHDARVIDAEGKLWPFYPWATKGSRAFEAYGHTVLNQSMVEEREGVPAHLRVELQLKNNQGRHNLMKLTTAGQDFIRKVELFGSADRKTWGKLGEGYVIDQSRPTRIQNKDVRYTDGDFAYLQIRIYRNARHTQEKVAIEKVQFGKQVVVRGEWESVTLTPFEPTSADQKLESKEARVAYFNSGWGNRPIRRLNLSFADQEFSRTVNVWGRASAEQDWRLITARGVYRLGSSEQLRVDLGGVRYRYLKLEVFHYDDDPLTLKSVQAEAVPRYLVVEAASKKPAFIYYGADATRPVTFDLETRKGPAQGAIAPIAQLGTRMKNPGGIAPNYGKWLPALAVGGVSLIVIWVIVGMLKNPPARE
jgi:hypothetical protein